MLRDLLSIYLVLSTRFLFLYLHLDLVSLCLRPFYEYIIVLYFISWNSLKRFFGPFMFVCNPASLQVEKGEDVFWCFRTVKQLVDVNITKDMPRVQNFLFSTKFNFFPV